MTRGRVRWSERQQEGEACGSRVMTRYIALHIHTLSNLMCVCEIDDDLLEPTPSMSPVFP
jgi:hypothetical protein